MFVRGLGSSAKLQELSQVVLHECRWKNLYENKFDTSITSLFNGSFYAESFLGNKSFRVLNKLLETFLNRRTFYEFQKRH